MHIISRFISYRPQISCGSQHNLALDEKGQVYVWGLNNREQLGDSDSTSAFYQRPTLLISWE